ncbi:MAG: hypothetical protein PVG14_15125 [Anaerolineales bacterium]|jgi:hypothetical protein
MIDRILDKVFNIDERFIMHRYYSTRWAIAVGLLMMGVWLLYEFYINGNLRMDLMVILGAMGLTKILAMFYYRITQ